MHWGAMAPPKFFKSSLIIGKTSSQSFDLRAGPPSHTLAIRTPFPDLKSPLFSHKDSSILFFLFSIKSTATGRSLLYLFK